MMAGVPETGWRSRDRLAFQRQAGVPETGWRSRDRLVFQRQAGVPETGWTRTDDQKYSDRLDNHLLSHFAGCIFSLQQKKFKIHNTDEEALLKCSVVQSVPYIHTKSVGLIWNSVVL